MKNWYILQTFSSFEQKVADTLKDIIKKKELEDKIEDVLVPVHEVTEVKRGKRVQRKKKYFPGYVLIKSEMDNDLYHLIKNIKKVSGFLGSKGIPVPVSDKEIEKKFAKMMHSCLVVIGLFWKVNAYLPASQISALQAVFTSLNGLEWSPRRNPWLNNAAVTQ